MSINMIISLLVFILTLVTAVAAFFAPAFFKKHIKVKPIYLIITGMFISVFVVMLNMEESLDLFGAATTIPLAILHSIQIMLVGFNFADMYRSFDASINSLGVPTWYLAVLFICAPICTFSFVLSFFESITSYFKYIVSWKKDVYIMSELTDRSLILAESIRKRFPDSLIIFANVYTDNDKIHEMTSDADDIDATFFNFDMHNINLKLHSKNSKVTFFAIGTDESANIEIALSAIEKFKFRQNTDMYVFSTSKEGGILLDSADFNNMRVRRVNEDQSLAYATIYNENDLITKHVSNTDGKKVISVLIIGFGGYGTELTKAFLWCGQLPGYDLEIHIIDKDENAESKFTAQCPEIMSLNNNTDPYEVRYSLNFHNGIDINTYEFNKVVSSLKNTSVVYISLGNDELNIETAIQTRILLERVGVYPVIRTVVHSEVKNNILASKGLINFKNQNYDIETIGNLKTRFSYETIINEKLESLALKHHLAWADDPATIEAETRRFNEIEYFRNSSTSTAIHGLYRKSENLSGQVAVLTEHLRWNAYMRTEGYVYSGSNDKASRNDRAKVHHDLVRQTELIDHDIAKDQRMTEIK